MTDQTDEFMKSKTAEHSKQATLYHISPVSNLLSIAREGVNPAYSKGKLKRSYWVIPSLVQWALLHISARQKVNVGELRVFTAHISLNALTNTSLPGVYQVKEAIFCDHVDIPEVFYQKDINNA